MVDNFLYIYIYKKVMPYAYRKIRNQNAYRVFNKITGVIHSNHTTLENAKKQIRLLNAIENNPNFKPRKVGTGGSEYGTDDELVAIDEDRIRRIERQQKKDRQTQLQIDRLNALKLIPNPTERDKISIGFLEKQIEKALMERGEEGYAISPEPIIEPSQPSKKPRSGSGVKKVGTGDRTPPQTQPNLRTPTPPQPPTQPQRIIIPSNPQNPLQILLTPTRRRNRRGGVPVIPNIIPPLPATPEQQFIIQQPIQTQPQPAIGVNLFGNPPATQPNQIGSSSSSASSTPRQDYKRRRTGRGTAGSKEVASITEDAKKRGEELKKRIAEIEKSNVKKADTLKKAELKRIKAELKKIEEEDPDYVGVDIPEINTGKGLPAGDIQKLLKNSYQIPPAETVGDFVLDKSLSGRRVQVYKNRNSPQAVVVHRGTQGVKDWATDLFYATGGDTTQTNRFKHAADIQKKAESKYGAKNITTLGHSLGAKISSTVGQNSKEIINLNKAVSPLDAVQKTSSKEINIRTSGDPVSALLPIKNNQRTITIPSKTYNPLTEHSTDTLNRLPANQIIGSGSAISAIRQAFRGKPYVIEGLERIEKADMKDTIFLAVFRMARRYIDEEETIPLGNTPFDDLFDFLKENYETEYQGGFYQEIAAEIINNRNIPARDLKEVVIDWIYSSPEFQQALVDTSAPTEAEVVGEPPIAEATIQGEGLKGRYKNRKSVVPFENRMFDRGVEIMPTIGEAEDIFKYKDLSIGEISSLIQVQHDKGDYDNMKEPLKSLVYALDVKTKRGYGIKRGGAAIPPEEGDEYEDRATITQEEYMEQVRQERIRREEEARIQKLIDDVEIQRGFIEGIQPLTRNSDATDILAVYDAFFDFWDAYTYAGDSIIGDIGLPSVAQTNQYMIQQYNRIRNGLSPTALGVNDVDSVILNRRADDLLNQVRSFVLNEDRDTNYSAAVNLDLPNTNFSRMELELLAEPTQNEPPIKRRRGEGIKVDLAKKISPSNKKMVGKTNPWVEYVKSFAKGKGINYAAAMKHPDLKKGYKKGGMVEENESGDEEDKKFKKAIKRIKNPFNSAKEQDVVSCPYCNKEYKYKGLSRHIATVHPGLPYEYRRKKNTPSSDEELPIKKEKGMNKRTRPLTTAEKEDIYFDVSALVNSSIPEAKKKQLISVFNDELDNDIVVIDGTEEAQIQRIKDGYIESINTIAGENITKGRGVRRINKPVAIRGRGMPTSREAVIAEAYDAKELGANGGKKYVSL